MTLTTKFLKTPFPTNYDEHGNARSTVTIVPDRRTLLAKLRDLRARKSLMGEMTYEEMRAELQEAVSTAINTTNDRYAWVRDFNSSWVVYDLWDQGDSTLYAAPYAVGLEGQITLGDATEVEAETDYRPVGGSSFVAKRGARNSRSDLSMIQSMHDNAVSLGASCPTTKSVEPERVVKATAGPVLKSDDAKRYTFGPWYPASPETPSSDHLDAHGDVATADDLQEAVWDYVRNGDRSIRKQHLGAEHVIGEWVELVSWPHAVTVPMTTADGSTVEKSFEPGTVFMGVVWSDDAWDDVQKGLIRGYSLGGSAVRVDVEVA
jgi:hypothetical protein